MMFPSRAGGLGQTCPESTQKGCFRQRAEVAKTLRASQDQPRERALPLQGVPLPEAQLRGRSLAGVQQLPSARPELHAPGDPALTSKPWPVLGDLHGPFSGLCGNPKA